LLTCGNISVGGDEQLARFAIPIRFLTAERKAISNAARNIPPPLWCILRKTLHPMKKLISKYNDLLILLIIWIISIYSVATAIVNSYESGIPNYIGYSLLIGISILRIFTARKFKIVLGIVLIFGTINAIQFTYSTITLIFNWSPLGQKYASFGIQPLSISLLCLLIVLNFNEFGKLIVNLLSEDPALVGEKKKLIEQKNYDKLINEKDDKLQEIIANRKIYELEFVKAAQRILNERNK
jgi:hypothetical protein